MNAPKTSPDAQMCRTTPTAWPTSSVPMFRKCSRGERGNKARAAKALDINRRSLYRLLEKHGIDAAECESASESVEKPTV